MLSIQVSTVLLAFFILGGNAEDSNEVTECSSRCSQMGGKCMTTGEECKGLDTISLNCGDGISCNCCLGEGKHEVKKREIPSKNKHEDSNERPKKKTKKTKKTEASKGKSGGNLNRKGKKSGRNLNGSGKQGINKKSRSGSKKKPRNGKGSIKTGNNKLKGKNNSKGNNKKPKGRKTSKTPGNGSPKKKKKKGKSRNISNKKKGKSRNISNKKKGNPKNISDKKKGKSRNISNKKKSRRTKKNKNKEKPTNKQGRKSNNGQRKNPKNGKNSLRTGDDDNKNCDFKCKNGNCGKNKRKCDKIDDCGDNTDEQGCNFATKLTCHRCKTWDTGDVGAKYDTSCGNTGYDGTVDNADTLDPFVGCAIKVYNNGDVVRLFESWQYNATQGNCFTGADHDSKDPEYQYIRCWCKGNNCNTGLCEECGVDESKNNKH